MQRGSNAEGFGRQHRDMCIEMWTSARLLEVALTNTDYAEAARMLALFSINTLS